MAEVCFPVLISTANTKEKKPLLTGNNLVSHGDLLSILSYYMVIGILEQRKISQVSGNCLNKSVSILIGTYTLTKETAGIMFRNKFIESVSNKWLLDNHLFPFSNFPGVANLDSCNVSRSLTEMVSWATMLRRNYSRWR